MTLGERILETIGWSHDGVLLESVLELHPNSYRAIMELQVDNRVRVYRHDDGHLWVRRYSIYEESRYDE